jgi:hypothetical protein
VGALAWYCPAGVRVGVGNPATLLKSSPNDGTCTLGAVAAAAGAWLCP